MTDWPPREEESPTEEKPPVPPEYMAPTSDQSGFVQGYEGFADRRPTAGEIGFDVTALSGDQRRLVSFRLNDLRVTHRIVDDALIVGTEDATAAQGQLDALAPEPVAPPPEPEAPEQFVTSDPVPPPEPEVGPEATTAPEDWMHPEPVDTAPVLDPPVVERTEPEEIEVPASEDIDEVIDEADEDEDEIVFDLAALSAEERRHLTMRLTGANISHIWEVGTDLVVSVEDAAVIETYIEEVRNPDGFGDEELAAFDEDSDVDDEAIYAAMSNLYVAADKLMQKPGDDALAGEFYLAADDVDGLPAPFGFDPRVWQQVLALTDSICGALDNEADPETVGTDAANLRQLLVNYV